MDMQDMIHYALGMGVYILGCAGFVAGRRISHTRFFPLILAGCFLLLGVYAFANWVPLASLPQRVVFASQRDTALLLALTIPILLGLLAARLPEVDNRKALHVFCLVALLYPAGAFFMTGWDAPELRTLHTTFSEEGVCLQTTDYTCGPAAAVTALRILGIDAEEGALALQAGSNSFTGTGPRELGEAMRVLYGVAYTLAVDRRIEPYAGRVPFLVDISIHPFLDHWVTVLEITDGGILVADPYTGLEEMEPEEFHRVWNRRLLLLHPESVPPDAVPSLRYGIAAGSSPAPFAFRSPSMGEAPCAKCATPRGFAP